MTEIEQKALALVEGILPEDAYRAPDHFIDKRLLWNALCRAIEQHEDFRQEVSAAVEGYAGTVGLDSKRYFARSIIPKADPLVEVIAECDGTLFGKHSDYAAALRAALAARGLEIREKQP